jgi:hypothetical protein
VAGVLTNVGLSILYQRELNPFFPPTSARAQFVGVQERIDQQLFGDPPQGVTFAQHLPKVEAAGSLVILRNCASLYQSTGTSWAAVERSGAGGHYRLDVTFGAVRGAADVYWPLLVTGERGVGSYVAVRPVGPDEVRFGYLIQGPHSTWEKGLTAHVTPGRSYVVDIVLDTDDNDQAVTLNGTTVSSGIYVRAPEHVTFGVDTIGGPTAPAFAGQVERLATPTPTCDSLRRRLDRSDR